jgi:hypothetical protein
VAWRSVASSLGVDAQSGTVGGHVDVRCVFGVWVAIVHAGQWCVRCWVAFLLPCPVLSGALLCAALLCSAVLSCSAVMCYPALLCCAVLSCLILACSESSGATSRLALRPISYPAAKTWQHEMWIRRPRTMHPVGVLSCLSLFVCICRAG